MKELSLFTGAGERNRIIRLTALDKITEIDRRILVIEDKK